MPYPIVDNGDSGSVARGKINAGLTAQRTILAVDTTYYVATTGNDANPGTVGSPFATIQHAIDVVKFQVTVQNISVIIQIADGTYDENLWLGPIDGALSNDEEVNGAVVIRGNVADETAVIIAPSTPAPNFATIYAAGFCNWYIDHVTIKTQTSGNEGVFTLTGAFVTLAHCIFGDNITGGAFDCENRSTIQAITTVFNGTVDNLVYSATDTIVHLSSGVLFSIDPGLSGGMFVVDDNAVVVVRDTITGTVASPGQSTVANGSVLNVTSPLLPDSNVTVDATSSYNGKSGVQSKAGLPANTDLPPGTSAVFKDTSGGGVYLAYNDAGTIKKVALT